MDVTGVGLRAVPSDMAKVRATIEARRMVNTTLTEGNLEPDQLTALISKVQTQVSKKSTAVGALLTEDSLEASGVNITKLRTSG